MRGSYLVRVENARVQFKLTLTRSLTVIRGNSATGKTTLVGLVAEYEQEGPASGITLSSDKPCVVLAGRDWERELAGISDSFVFIDEGNDFVRTQDFARAARDSSNYYVLVTREDLPMLPYSVEEVYELRNTTSRYPGVRKYYTHTKRMYASLPNVLDPQKVIVEDSNAGFAFYQALCRKSGIECVSAHGKGNVLATLRGCGNERVLIIADGAAFGPQMEMVLALAQRKGAGLFLPESFEWVVLRSGLVRDSEVGRMLADPSAFVESRDYFSWERFFTAILVDKTAGTYLQYNKAALNPSYLQPRELAMLAARVADALPTGEDGRG